MISDPQVQTDRSDDSPAQPQGAGRPTRPRRSALRRLVPTWRVALGGFLLLLLLLTGGLIAGYMLVHIPPANAAAVKQSNVYLYADGSPLARDGEVNRENVPLAQVPRSVQQAVLSAEDRDFYTEPAIDVMAMIRGAWNTVTGKGKQSGSTITQQYVKNYYLAQEQTVTRKVKEFFIAIKLDREKSKEHILTGYLNTSYFGRNAYGIQAAAQAYYGKAADRLTTAEGAYLAALLNAPSAYDVETHPENRARAEARWNYVLDGMVKEDWLAQSERAGMVFPKPGKTKVPPGMSGQRGYLVEAINSYLVGNAVIDEDTLQAGGYRITTTLQKRKQNALREAVTDQLMDGLSDSRPVDRYVRAGGASIDPRTGKVVAMFGGVDYTKQFVNNATRRDYQVGSTFKPFVFASAVQNGSTTLDGRRITPSTTYDGSNRRQVQSRNGPTGYRPANEDDVDYGQITVAEATDKSVNAVYAQMGEDVGPDNVKKTAVGLGIPKDAPGLAEAQQSVGLGVVNASVLDMTKAYATLANHGRHGKYTLVEEITRGGERVSLHGTPGGGQAITREAADTTTSILQSVVQKGTGTAAQIGRPAAGKTGTAENDKAAWFAGYTPDLATVVAVMGQDPENGEQKPLYGAGGLGRVNGGDYPAQIWSQYMAEALVNTPASSFDLRMQSGASMPDLSSGSPSESSSESGGASPPDNPSGSAPAEEEEEITSSDNPKPPTDSPSSPASGPSSPATPREDDDFFPDF
ncbi:transglycosylase domain-containing protein [Streptomyces pathocidini]|uniref:Transglycosylase domain-containing protein n=1 Tax=Streptomyces pathocidini TaxID=1650571 RepID=A0ABW7UTU2_9ACTN|nr:transglycosylase domain-containing protein [Streptomyces pathocidini]